MQTNSLLFPKLHIHQDQRNFRNESSLRPSFVEHRKEVGMLKNGVRTNYLNNPPFLCSTTWGEKNMKI